MPARERPIAVNDWVAYADARTAHCGVVTSIEKKTVHVHAFQHSPRLRRLTACWLDSSVRTKLGDYSRPGYVPACYLIDRDAILATAPRDDKKSRFDLPLKLKRAMAAYHRDPFAPP
jgi:hypothetical protein